MPKWGNNIQQSMVAKHRFKQIEPLCCITTVKKFVDPCNLGLILDSS